MVTCWEPVLAAAALGRGPTSLKKLAQRSSAFFFCFSSLSFFGSITKRSTCGSSSPFCWSADPPSPSSSLRPPFFLFLCKNGESEEIFPYNQFYVGLKYTFIIWYLIGMFALVFLFFFFTCSDCCASLSSPSSASSFTHSFMSSSLRLSSDPLKKWNQCEWIIFMAVRQKEHSNWQIKLRCMSA